MQCPICKRDGTVSDDLANDSVKIDCPNCGRFMMTKTFYASDTTGLPESPSLMPRLRKYIQSQNEKNVVPDIGPTWRSKL
jgi:hypothetical protein